MRGKKRHRLLRRGSLSAQPHACKLASACLTVHAELDRQRKLGEFLTYRVRFDDGPIAVHQVGQTVFDHLFRMLAPAVTSTVSQPSSHCGSISLAASIR